MTTVRIVCEDCAAPIEAALPSVAMFVCREKEELNVIGFECPVHGLVAKALTLEVFYRLQTAQFEKDEPQPPIFYVTLDEMLREFSEELPATLARILSDAA